MATFSLPSLTPQQHKALRNQHPLYERLSGESVWVFLEELGLTEGQCEQFMEAFFRQMDHILACMAALKNQPRLQGQIVGRSGECCSPCTARIGKLVRLDETADTVPQFPPFGIGCPLSLRLVDREADQQPADSSLADAPQEHPVLCARLAADPENGLRHFLASPLEETRQPDVQNS